MSPALRRTIRQIIEHQQASLEWLKAMMRVRAGAAYPRRCAGSPFGPPRSCLKGASRLS